ncbi:MAG: hypothetical protein GQ534_02395 [Candidatus Delongbacteria bacterium]|nr:hypothetical protein [Candidatus Delongbacteria bacterium]
MKKKTVLIVIVMYLNLLFLTSCTSYNITRSGYDIYDVKNSRINIEAVTIHKYGNFHTTDYERIGDIKLGDGPLTGNCSESNAIRMLREEAASIGADIVNVVDERRPDMISTCYRCQAEFYRSKDPSKKIQSSVAFKDENINERERGDSGTFLVSAVVAITLGIVTGLLLASKTK